MADKHTNRYAPDYAVSPGEVLEDHLESLGMTQAELATRTGLTPKTINEIIKGKSPITHETALKFERALGRPAHFWNNLEQQYQEDRIRLEEQERLKSYRDWLKNVPVNAMSKLGWIAKHKDKDKQLEEALRFFGVVSPDQWRQIWQEYQVAYRQTQRFGFQEILDDARELTRESPDVFVPKLVEQAASAGVAVVFVPELPKTRVSGATRWLKGKAIIQLSLRYKSNDQLWFTFFHEAGHILKHGRKEVFIEGSGLDGDKEEEANAFARDKLIPPAAYRRFLERWDRLSLDPIKTFAEEVGIAPGIVVGRLQHDGLLPPSHGNKLKVFLEWKKAA